MDKEAPREIRVRIIYRSNISAASGGHVRQNALT